jgi:hypothetical protein
MLRLIAALVVANVLVAQGQAADIRSQVWNGKRYHIIITGKIEAGDEKSFRDVALSIFKQGNVISAVSLYSPGGNVRAAMAIGKEIRETAAETVGPWVFKGKRVCSIGSAHEDRNDQTGNCDCRDACFFIWAGGTGRLGELIGIQKPAYNNEDYAGLNDEDARKAFSGLNKEAVSYLRQMSVPEKFIHKMFEEGNQANYYLSQPEITEFNNRPAALAKSLEAGCGPRPARGSEGSIGELANSLSVKWGNCVSPIIESNLADYAQRYVAKYDQH